MAGNTYSPSVNIIRDANRDLVYYPTPNAQKVVHQLANDYKKGIRAFNIVGAYGTGKSSLLWALEQSFYATKEPKRKRFFDVNLIADPLVEVVNFVGEYASIIKTFAGRFGVDGRKAEQSPYILSEIFNRYHDLGKRGSGQPLLVLVIDEFGKFLEYAVQHEPEKEFYFIQQLAEFANNTDHNICLITTVHQNIDAYSFSLNDTQRKEWTKVKGRFREITFNEPVEQLLLLAGEHLANGATPPDAPTRKAIQTALTLAQESNSTKLDAALAPGIAANLFPLDLLSATALTLSLQRYGQNERSLFSFLESTDHTGLGRVRLTATNPFYDVANVFDYLTFNYYSYLNSRDNRDYAAWMGMRATLEKVEGVYGADAGPYEKLVKTVGLLALLMPLSAKLDKTFLVQYAETCLGLTNAAQLITDLEQQNIIHYRVYRTRYVPNEGTDLNFQQALQQAGNDVDEIKDVATLLQRHYQLPPVLAKKHSYKNGTPRLFEYWISERPMTMTPTGEIDGYINLIFNNKLPLGELREHAATPEQRKKAILYVYYHNTEQIREQLFDIEKTQKVIEQNEEDTFALRELTNILEHQRNLLNHLILDGLFQPGKVTWVFQDGELTVQSPKELNILLSAVCDEVYDAAPEFRNELVNRHKLSSSIAYAKRSYLQQLVGHWGEPDLGFDTERFPPEKTIYLSLLAQNGLTDTWGQVADIDVPTLAEVAQTSSFRALWNECEKFLDSAKQSRRTVAELVELLSAPPFKLKQGLLEFWVPTFLFVKRDDFALFEDTPLSPAPLYIPELSWEVLELIVKTPQKFALKAFGVAGLRLDLFNSYRHLFNQSTQLRFSNQAFIETVKPLLTFYRTLPEYAKQTKQLSKEALAVRAAIADSQEPEKTFFEDFPMALGYSSDALQTTPAKLEIYIDRLQDAIREIRLAYDELLNRFETFLLTEYVGETVPFEAYKARLQLRFTTLNRAMLSAGQKTFVQRLDSQLDDRNAWLNSMAQAVVGRPLDGFRNTDEAQLYAKFDRLMRDLDNLTFVAEQEADAGDEQVFSMKISSLVDGIREDLIRMPKSKQAETERIEKDIKKLLSTNYRVNIAALTDTLNQLLNAPKEY